MRRLLTFLAIAIFAALPALAQTTAITATHLAQDVSGTLLASGKLCFLPINQQGVPTGFELSGIQYAPSQACYTITAGAISGVSLPDTALLSPTGVGYLPTIEDSTGKPLYTYTQAIYPTGTTFSLDTWSPTASAVIQNPATVQYGVNAPVGRCGVNPALYYTAANIYTCQLQVWVVVTGSGGGGTVTSSQITTALGFLPVTATQLASAVSTAISAIPAVTSSQITTAIGYTPANVTALANYLPLAGGTLSGALLLNDGSLAASQAYVITAITGSSASPTATPTFSIPGGTYTATINVALSDATAGATISYCTNALVTCMPNNTYGSPISVPTTETICTNAIASSGGIVSSTTCGTYTITGSIITTGTNTGIGTIIAQGYETDGSISFKTCYVGGSVCSGGVGSIALSSVPDHTFGLNTPSASTGVSNEVGDFHLETATPGASGTQFSMALWTTSGGGFGNNPTATNFYVGGWIKEGYPAGPSRIEFDTYAFDSGWDWMFGTQCNSDKMLLQHDNQLDSHHDGGGWIYTSVPCAKLYDGNYHHVEMTYHRTLAADRSCGTAAAPNSAPCECWDTATIDSVSYAINVCRIATPASWSGSGWQFQIDGAPTNASSSSPAKYDLWLDSAYFISGLAGSSGAPAPGGGGLSASGTGDLDSFNFDAGTSIPTGLTAVGSPVVVATQEHTTPNSAHFPSGLNYYTDSITPTKTIYTRQYVYINTASSTLSDSFLRFYHGTTELFVYFFDTPTRHITYFDQATSSSITAYSTSFPTGGWHYVETYTKIDPTVGHVTVKVDGTQVYDSGSFNTGTQTVDTVWFGNIGATAPTGWDTYEDNVDFDDSGFIGPI
jgi:hypothetical protein